MQIRDAHDHKAELVIQLTDYNWFRLPATANSKMLCRYCINIWVKKDMPLLYEFSKSIAV